MARLENFSKEERAHLLALPCPMFDTAPFVTGPPLSERRLALITTAGLHRRGDRPFEAGSSDYRLIPTGTPAQDLVMSHISTNFDRTGFQSDLNIVFPLDRLSEFADHGIIGGLAEFHYSFMGATEPQDMKKTAVRLAQIMKKDSVDAVLLVPV